MCNDIRHFGAAFHDTLRGLPTGEDGVKRIPVNNQQLTLKRYFCLVGKRAKKRCYRLFNNCDNSRENRYNLYER